MTFEEQEDLIPLQAAEDFQMNRMTAEFLHFNGAWLAACEDDYDECVAYQTARLRRTNFGYIPYVDGAW